MASNSRKTLLSVPEASASSGSATGNPRNKTALQPGCSLMDWVALMNSGKDLTGTGGKMLRVSLEDLKKHGPETKEPWIALQGLVYNITHYKRFHPGGVSELLRGAGMDATRLFNEIHPWVSFQSMLSKCLVGKLVDVKTRLPPPPAVVAKKSVPSLLLPPPVPSIPTLKSDFYQTDSSIVISIYLRKQSPGSDQVLVETLKSSSETHIRILIFNFEEDFIENVYSLGECEDSPPPSGVLVKISPMGKVEVSLSKSSPGRCSISLVHLKRVPRFEDNLLRPWTLSGKKKVTHDVTEFKFTRPKSLLHFKVPLGHHVSFSLGSVQKMYTPASQESEELGFLIKIYPNGALTSRLDALNIGDDMRIGNPRGSFRPPKVDLRLRLFAGGSGITPMLRLIEHYLPLKTQIKLYFFNKTKEDIILQERIVEWSTDPHFSVLHCLSQESSSLEPSHISGRVSHSLLEGVLDEESDRASESVLICGPIPFTRETFRLLTENFNYPPGNIFKFGS